MGGRKINFHSNLFLLIANAENGTMLHSRLHSLYTTNSSILVVSFSLEHGSRLHESHRPTDSKTKVDSFYPFLGKKLKSLACVSLILSNNACYFNIDLLKFTLLVYDVYKHMYEQFAFSCFGELCLCHIYFQYLMAFKTLSYLHSIFNGI